MNLRELFDALQTNDIQKSYEILFNKPLANKPADMSDTGIHALHELTPPVLSRVPEEDWHIDIDDEGAMTGKCPRCGCTDISAITPEWLACLGCGHREGEAK